MLRATRLVIEKSGCVYVIFKDVAVAHTFSALRSPFVRYNTCFCTKIHHLSTQISTILLGVTHGQGNALSVALGEAAANEHLPG